MIDLTKITTPFGLLGEATQSALHAHGGPYELFNGEKWVEAEHLAAWPHLVYRVKPAPPKPREWWAAFSQSGTHIGLWTDYQHAYQAAQKSSGSIVHVREVLE